FTFRKDAKSISVEFENFMMGLVSVPVEKFTKRDMEIRNGLLERLSTVIADAETVSTLASLDDARTGNRGTEITVLALPAFPVLISLLDNFRALEQYFPDPGWRIDTYLAQSQT